jgi:hypothetical protein
LFAFSFEQLAFTSPTSPALSIAPAPAFNTFETQFDLFGNPSVMIARDENGARTWRRFDSSGRIAEEKDELTLLWEERADLYQTKTTSESVRQWAIDTGEGVSPKDLSRLFEPFFTTKPEGKGNGLGLYLVKKLVEENQGSISLESFPNEGTAVTLAFPLSRL